MSDIKLDQPTELNKFKIKMSSNAPSEQAIGNLISQLFYLYSKCINKHTIAHEITVAKVG